MRNSICGPIDIIGLGASSAVALIWAGPIFLGGVGCLGTLGANVVGYLAGRLVFACLNNCDNLRRKVGCISRIALAVFAAIATTAATAYGISVLQGMIVTVGLAVGFAACSHGLVVLAALVASVTLVNLLCRGSNGDCSVRLTCCR